MTLPRSSQGYEAPYHHMPFEWGSLVCACCGSVPWNYQALAKQTLPPRPPQTSVSLYRLMTGTHQPPSLLTIPYSVQTFIHWTPTELPGLLFPMEQYTPVYYFYFRLYTRYLYSVLQNTHHLDIFLVKTRTEILKEQRFQWSWVRMQAKNGYISNEIISCS